MELKPGMIVSNEPGYYLKNSHGIRIENLLLIKEPKKLTRMQKIPTLYFETLTHCPLDKELIIKDLLDRNEIDWINNYHLQIIKKYEKKLLIEQRDWLNKICSPI